MNQSIPRAKNVLYIHAMGAWEGLGGFLGSGKALNDKARFFAPNPTVFRLKGIHLFNEASTYSHALQSIRDHIAEHGTIDELILDAHGSYGRIHHFGSPQFFLKQLATLQTELGKPIAARVVFNACNAFSFGLDAHKENEAMHSFARQLNAQVVGATSTVASLPWKNDRGPSIFGRFIKFAPDGSISRDVLDTPPHVIEEQIALAEKNAQPLRKLLSWPTKMFSAEAKNAQTGADLMRVIGWNPQAHVDRILVKQSKGLLEAIADEAPWDAERFSLESMSRKAAKTIEEPLQMAQKSHWGTAAVIGGIACVGAAWLVSVASKKKDHQQRTVNRPVQEMAR